MEWSYDLYHITWRYDTNMGMHKSKGTTYEAVITLLVWHISLLYANHAASSFEQEYKNNSSFEQE